MELAVWEVIAFWGFGLWRQGRLHIIVVKRLVRFCVERINLIISGLFEEISLLIHYPLQPRKLPPPPRFSLCVPLHPPSPPPALPAAVNSPS